MADDERSRDVRGRKPQANPFLIIGFMWTMMGIAFWFGRTWGNFGITFLIIGVGFLIVGVIQSFKNK